jgi:hypothetical protein
VNRRRAVLCAIAVLVPTTAETGCGAEGPPGTAATGNGERVMSKGRALIALPLAVILYVVLAANTSCGEAGTSGSEATGAPAVPKPKPENVSIEWDWPEGRQSVVTIYWNVPETLTGRMCESGARHTKVPPGWFEGGKLVHRVEPPLICEWGNFLYGTVSTTGMQQEKGYMYCGIYKGWMHREMARKSTTKPGELISCKFTNPKPEPNA